MKIVAVVKLIENLFMIFISYYAIGYVIYRFFISYVWCIITYRSPPIIDFSWSSSSSDLLFLIPGKRERKEHEEFSRLVCHDSDRTAAVFLYYDI